MPSANRTNSQKENEDNLTDKHINIGRNVEHFVIADIAKENLSFRKVLWTGEHSQLVAMTVPVGGEIGDEVHETTDQLLSFVSGTGEADLDGHSHAVDAGDLCAVPAGEDTPPHAN